MERATKTAIKKLVLDLRHLLEEDIEVVLKRYGLFTNRDWLEESRIPKADAELLAIRARMEAAVSVEMARGIKRGEATRWYIREVAFTYLNRLVGLKCLEVRGLIDEVITTRVKYGGRSQFHRDFRHDYPQLAAKPDDALPDMLEAACRFVTNEMIGVLFDPDSESSAVWPRVQTLRQAIGLINGLPAEVWAEDEIIGWIYQFYNAEEKERIRKRGKPTLPIEVAVINQFFTPRWVVKYLVDNTLGRLWLEMYPDSARVRAKCDYLVPEPLPTGDEAAEAEENKFTPDPDSPINNPLAPARRQAKPVTQIRLIDPACGAMHFGYYAFEVFQEMYREARERGWPIWSVDYSKRQSILPPPSDTEIPALILAHNLYGVDIDLRAVQLAALALYMKARVAERDADPQHRSQYRVNLVCADARLTNGGLRQRFLEQYKDDPKLQQVWRELFTEMEDIAQVGSLLRPEERLRQLLETYQPPTIQFETTQQLQLPNVPQKPRQMMLAEAPGGEKWTPRRTLSQMVADLHRFARKALTEADVNAQLFAMEAEKTVGLLSVLSQEYEVAVMNPPYGYTTLKAKQAITTAYPKTGNDLFSAFIERGLDLVSKNGYTGMLTSRSFMFLPTFQKTREDVLLKNEIVTLAELGIGILDDATVRVAAYVVKRGEQQKDKPSIFFGLRDEENREAILEKSLRSITNGTILRQVFLLHTEEFHKLPKSTFAYWASHSLLTAFDKYPPLDKDVVKKKSRKIADVKVGLQTGSDEKFVRQHWEISSGEKGKGKKWVRFAKGGTYSPYYSDFDLVVHWQNNGNDIKNYTDSQGRLKSRPQNEIFYFREGLTYPATTEKGMGVYHMPKDTIPSVKGSGIYFCEADQLWYGLGILNSRLMEGFLRMFTVDRERQVGMMSSLPFDDQAEAKTKQTISQLAKQAHDLKAVRDTGNEICTHFATPWLLQICSPDDNGSVARLSKITDTNIPPNTVNLKQMLDIVQTLETNLDSHLQQTQCKIDEVVYSLYQVSVKDQKLIEQELGKRSPLVTWPEMEGKSKKEKRREHVRRLLSHFILQAIKIDKDGILPFFPGTGHPTVLEQLRRQMELEFGAKAAFQLEDDAGKELGRSVESWLDGPFIQWHTSLYKKRPILWHLASPNNSFAVLLYYHKLDKDTLPKIRNVYLRALRDGLRRQLDAARQASDNKTITQLETTLDDLLQMEERLQAVIDSGYNPIIDDGVKANILPLQEAGLLRYNKVV